MECKSSILWTGEGREELSTAASIVTSNSWGDTIIVAKLLTARPKESKQGSRLTVFKVPTEVFGEKNPNKRRVSC
jgi:hypothetical protein